MFLWCRQRRLRQAAYPISKPQALAGSCALSRWKRKNSSMVCGGGGGGGDGDEKRSVAWSLPVSKSSFR